VLEGVPDIVSELITKEVDIPTIGIGAGPAPDRQVAAEMLRGRKFV